MKAEESVLETIGIVGRTALLVLAIVFCCLAGVFKVLSPTKTLIEEIRLDDKQIIKIWEEGDLNHPDSIFYEITKANEVVVPATMIKPVTKWNDSYEIRVAFAQNKTLVCVYDLKYWDDGLLILYNTQTGVSTLYQGYSEDWSILYAQLRAENPSLPKVGR
jgi:hypothetical protein